MTPSAIVVAAVLAQMLLALLIYGWLGRKRLPLVAKGEVRIADIALDKENWPEEARKASNALDNQFQLPVLFYISAMLTVVLAPHWLDALLAVAFVISRYVHAYIHITSNHVIRRHIAFVTGFWLMVAWWLTLSVRLFLRLVSGV